MQDLESIKNQITHVYLNAKDTVERYNILSKIIEHISDLRNLTVNQIDEGKFDYPNDILNTDSVFSRIQHILANYANVHIDTIKALVHIDSKISLVLAELSLDSLDYVEIIMTIEQEFDIEISDRKSENFDIVEDIIDFIQYQD